MGHRPGKRETKKILASYNVDVTSIADYQTQICKIDNSIEVINDQIESLKAKISKLNDKKVQVGTDLLQTDIIWELYYKTGVSASDICETFGIKNASELRKIISGCTVKISCCQCSTKLEFHPTSRANLKEILDDKHLCNLCLEANKQKFLSALEYDKMQSGLRLQELKEMDYKDYLQTPEWNATRKKMLRRADYKCQLCNANKITLNVHHKTYDRLGEENYDDLIVLCENCHAKFHDKEIST